MSLLGVDFDPRVLKADLICARVSAHCDQHLINTDSRSRGYWERCSSWWFGGDILFKIEISNHYCIINFKAIMIMIN